MALNVKQQIKKQGFETSQGKKKTKRRYTVHGFKAVYGLSQKMLRFRKVTSKKFKIGKLSLTLVKSKFAGLFKKLFSEKICHIKNNRVS